MNLGYGNNDSRKREIPGRDLKLKRELELKHNRERKNLDLLAPSQKLQRVLELDEFLNSDARIAHDDVRQPDGLKMGLSRSVTSNSCNAIIKEDSNVTKEEKNNSVKNSRCVSVDTISPTPEGRRKKKSGLSGKQELIKFRCSLMEKRILQEKAKKCDLSLSEFIRRCALEQVTVERLSDDEIELYKMLIKYHNNFKAIGNLMRGRNQGLTQMVYDTAKEIKLHLKKFSK